MTAELGQTNNPKELVPGNVGSVADTMWAMRNYGDSLHEAGVGLRRVDTREGWSGKAADNFREAFHGQPGKWLEAGDCFHDAATALDSYDSTLRWAQRQAGEAIRLWNEGDAATAQAKVEHAHAVQQAQHKAAAKTAAGTPTAAPNIPFSDPGEAKREAARQTLDRARRQLSSAGDTAADAVGKARDKAPKKPGFWSKIGSGISNFVKGAGHDIEVAGAQVVNSAASFGNAMLNHPGDVAAEVLGGGLTAVSAVGMGGGGALSLTGVGTIAGGPLIALSAAGAATGGGIMVAATRDLAAHAAGDDQVSPVRVDGGGSDGGGVGKAGTKTDRLKEHLTDRDLEAAQRESKGEVVARKSGGDAYDHVDEISNAQRGLVKRIEQIKSQLGDSRISDADRASLKSELSEASRLLDHSERYLPRH